MQNAFAVQHASFHMEQIMGEKLLIDYAGDDYCSLIGQQARYELRSFLLLFLLEVVIFSGAQRKPTESIFSEQYAAKPGVYCRCT